MVQSALYRLRTATRSVLRARGFAIAAILTLALGIGLSTAVFTVADRVLLRQLPVSDQDRIVSLWGTKPGDPARSAVGLLGVMLTMARQRTRELGVRLALGARPAQLSRMVLVRGVAIAVLGAAVGLAAALGLNGVLASMVYGVSATDGTTLAMAGVCLVATAAAASLIPARGVARLDPVIALRSDG